ncbi:MAG: cohesin domain-containing protein [Dehalococcoidia bacterium]
MRQHALTWLGLGMLAAAFVVGSSARHLDAAGTTELALTPASQNRSVGDEFEIQFSAQNFQNMGAFEVRVGFDPDILEFVSATPTDLITSTGRMSSCSKYLGDDYIQYGCNTTGSADSGVNGGGEAATLRFKAIGAGTSSLVFRGWNLASPLGDDAWGEDNDGDGRFNEDPTDGFDYDDDGQMDEDGPESNLIRLAESVVRVVGEGEPTPQNLPSTPTPNAANLTPTAIPGANQSGTQREYLPSQSNGGDDDGSGVAGSRTGRVAPRSNSGSSTGSADGAAAGDSDFPIAGHGPGSGDKPAAPWLPVAALSIVGSALVFFGWRSSRSARTG